MADDYVGAISTDDLREIKEIFENALDEGLGDLPDIKIDKSKIVNQYENEIRQKIRIDFPQSEQLKVQDLKSSIEKMELKARRMKQQLLIHRSRFIEGVRSNVEAELQRKLPECPEIDIDIPIQFSQNEIKLLGILDDQITEMEKQVRICEEGAQNKLPHLSSFATDAQKILAKYK